MKAHPSLKPGIWGAVIGAVAISVLGFSSFGWTLGSTAERMAQERGRTEVVAVLAPICVAKFQHQADASTKLVEFTKAASMGPAVDHREGWLGDGAGQRWCKLGGCFGVRRTARWLAVGQPGSASCTSRLTSRPPSVRQGIGG